jgi:spoIIIJ-associated protein
MEKEIKILIETFFQKLNIETDSIDVLQDEDNIFSVNIKSNESGILIWPHGKNLENIQWLLKLMVSKKIGERTNLHVEVNDYLESKDEKLFLFIKSKITFVENRSIDIALPFYGAYDRKKIHSFVSEHWNPDIYTKSIWEGKERRLYICTKAEVKKEIQEKKGKEKKTKKLTIDIDWDDI